MNRFALLTFLICGLAVSVHSQFLIGGNYKIEQSAVGGVGGEAAGGPYTLNGTGGQPVTGGWTSSSPYGINSGFWYAALAPTAAAAEIAGTVLGPSGEPLRNVTVMLSGGMFTTPLVVKTNNFGMFSFKGIEAGQIYVVGVVSGRYGFEQQNQVVTLTDDLTTIVFRAGWGN